jgi:hypothetical protein
LLTSDVARLAGRTKSQSHAQYKYLFEDVDFRYPIDMGGGPSIQLIGLYR